MTAQPRPERHDLKSDTKAPTAPATIISDSPDEESRWFCEIFGTIVGPLTLRIVREMLQRGDLSPSDRIRREFDEQWVNTQILQPNSASDVVAVVAAKVPLQPRQGAVATGLPSPQVKDSFDQNKASDPLSENQLVEEVLLSHAPTSPDRRSDQFLSQLASDMESDFEISPPQTESGTDSQMAAVTTISQPQHPDVSARRTVQRSQSNLDREEPSASPTPVLPATIRSAGRTQPRGVRSGNNFKLPLPAVGFAACLLLLLLLFWASRRSDPNVAYVQGKVTYRQQQIASAVITFADSSQGIGASANLKPDGNYEFVNRQGGLPFGTYEVTVTPRMSDVPAGTSTGPRLEEASNIPRKYRDPGTSGLKAVVVAGKNRFDFDLTD